MPDQLKIGDLVTYQWGRTAVRATVRELYGQPENRRVVLSLDPEMTTYLVAEPTTLALSVNDVTPVVAD